MVWRRSSEKEASAPAYMRLPSTAEDEADGETKMPRGYVPVVVGCGGAEERVLVHVRMLSEPCIVALLEMAGEQFGYDQRGVLRIPCDALDFRRMLAGGAPTACR